MSKKLYFLISFVLVLSWASAGYGSVKLDFDDPADPNVGGTSTEPNYVSFVLADTGTEPNDPNGDPSGIIIDIIDPDRLLDSRRRTGPNSVITQDLFGVDVYQEQIHRDFIFAPATESITVRIWGLGAGQQADLHLWAFDDMSQGSHRIADWSANGSFLFTTDFIGGDVLNYYPAPTLHPAYDFNGVVTADDVGSILLTSELGTDGTESEPFAYINALEVYPIGTPSPVTKAHRPVPFDGTPDIPAQPTLSWLAGDGAVTYKVYLSQDFDDVNNGSPSALVSPSQSATSYTPTDFLTLDRTYYWRVDVVTPAPVQGDVWSFVTTNNVVVDDFEAYGVGGLAIRHHWDDYWHNGSSAEVFIEQDAPVLDEKSMRYEFENSFGDDSEATIDLTQSGVEIDTNFARMDVQSLSIWFFGQSGNPISEQMYAIMEDGDGRTATVDYTGDMNNITVEQWQEWNISMQEFLDANSSLDLSDIEVVGIGFAYNDLVDGTVYFDDIRLYTYRCVLVERSATLANADFAPVSNEDCVIDGAEVLVMGRDWLLEDFASDTNDPGTDGLVAYYPLDDFNDANTFPIPTETHDFIFDMSDSNYLSNVLLTKNIAPSPHPNSLWAILSPIDPCDNTTEGTAVIVHPGVGAIIDTCNVNSPLYVDGNCVHFENDGGDPGERITCGRWPVVGNFFPGPGTHGSGGSSYQGHGDLSLSIWARWMGPHVLRTKCQGLISKRLGWDHDVLIFMFETDTIPGPRGSISMRQRDGDYCTYSAGGLMDQYIGQWVHLAAVAHITNDVNDVILYVNGAERQRGPFYFSGGDPYAISLTIGNDGELESSWGVENFRGDLDEVRVYNRPLTPEEVAFLADHTPDDGQISVPVPSPSNITDPEPQGQRYVNFKDFAVMANQWLKKEYWP